ncbi:hypothetical protein PMI04_009740 [Sphingobium sp. AP49]|uniref:hypothetical protein n=1 Tax=Sphingobium sp. AP49 TaxID=1144307 RepID=UPI00026EC888|nr:hypothetical protein [Sphingobium sp. AP49]WHO40842.1 hypothetical protein PMI04_009740 [Sphingobium sp. AP49]
MTEMTLCQRVEIAIRQAATDTDKAWAAISVMQSHRETVSFQQRVHPWMLECFDAAIAADMLERADRFVEEALELAQTMPEFSADRAHALVDYVFARPVGERRQEVGGVMVTLAALCLAAGEDMHDAGETELARINLPHIVEKIRAKQAAKPTGSALPIAECPSSPDGRHQVDTSMESGPNNCFHCEASMPRRAR